MKRIIVIGIILLSFCLINDNSEATSKKQEEHLVKLFDNLEMKEIKKDIFLLSLKYEISENTCTQIIDAYKKANNYFDELISTMKEENAAIEKFRDEIKHICEAANVNSKIGASIIIDYRMLEMMEKTSKE